MRYRSLIVSVAAALCTVVASAQAFDEIQVPRLDRPVEVGPSH